MADDVLRRYTDIPALIYLLREQAITLLDPESWDDKNDSHFLATYRDKRKRTCVLALCFTQVAESYHHWRVFAPGPSGVCIRFRKAELVAAIEAKVPVRAAEVTYLTLKELRAETLRVRDLPFLKRSAFEHETEYRIIYEAAKRRCLTKDVSIPLDTIEQITLSPWIPDGFADHLVPLIRSIDGCETLRIVRSTLISNQEWQRRGDAAK